MSEALVAELTQFLAKETGQSVRVSNARPLAGGASMETWAFDADVQGEKLALVMRRDMAANMYAGALTRAQEFALIAAAHEAGVRAPRPRWLYDAPTGAFFVMDRLPGESVGRRVVRLPELESGRAKMAGQMGTELAKIHALPLTDRFAFLSRPAAGERATDAALRMIRETMDSLARNNPVWEFAYRWLAQRAPAPSGDLAVVHGDFRVGNLLVTPEGMSGVLDWEFAHVGDPLEDLSWPLVRDWRFENDALRVGGVGNLDEYLAAYRAAGGRAVDPVALRWWEIVGNLRWAVFCHAQAERHLSGRDRSVELASLGRKAYEVEWEVLDLIRREEGSR